MAGRGGGRSGEKGGVAEGGKEERGGCKWARRWVGERKEGRVKGSTTALET